MVGLPARLRARDWIQGGNNNAYCQDNETSWFDWSLLAKHADLHRFVSVLNAHRVLRDVEHERQRATLDQLIRQINVKWHGVRLHEPDSQEWSHSLAFTARIAAKPLLFHVMLNAYWEPLEFELPPVANGDRDPWRRVIDTFLESPHDIVELEKAPQVCRLTYRMEPRSVALLVARDSDDHVGSPDDGPRAYRGIYRQEAERWRKDPHHQRAPGEP